MNTWFALVADTMTLYSRQPGSLIVAAPFSLIAARYLSNSAGAMSRSTAKMAGPSDCAETRWLGIAKNALAATISAIVAAKFLYDFSIDVLPMTEIFICKRATRWPRQQLAALFGQQNNYSRLRDRFYSGAAEL